MDIITEKNGNSVTIKPVGNIDFVTAPELDAVIEKEAVDASQLILDLSEVPYLASAGLRSILNADELMEDKEGFKIIKASPNIMAVFEMTGFADSLDIE